jgi:hypothetical protein
LGPIIQKHNIIEAAEIKKKMILAKDIIIILIKMKQKKEKANN